MHVGQVWVSQAGHKFAIIDLPRKREETVRVLRLPDVTIRPYFPEREVSKLAYGYIMENFCPLLD